MEGIGTLLVVVIVALTTLLFVVGVQVVLIINDLRKSIKRLNSILEDSILGGGLIRPEKLTGVIHMFRKRKTLRTEEAGSLHETPTN